MSPSGCAAASSSTRSVSAQRPVGRFSCGGSAAKRGTMKLSGGTVRSLRKLHEDRDGAVVDQLDLHVRAEAAAPRSQALAHALVERLGVLGRRGRDVAGAGCPAGGAREGGIGGEQPPPGPPR